MQRLAGVSAGFLLLAGATLAVAPGVASAASSDKPAAHGSNGAEPPGQSKGDQASPTGAAHAAAAPVSATAVTGPDAAGPTPGHGSMKQTAPSSKHANGALDKPQPLSNADKNSGGANGQCPGGAYCSTRDGAPSGNGNGKGKSVGKPCAGCVGKADNKNPKGQRPNGSDHNNGYECDGNHGIGRTNPAHTGCKTAPPQPPPACVPTPANHQCQTPPPPPPPACVPTPANHQCQTPPPPACVPTPANHQCQTPPPPPTACVPAPGEDENCVQVEGTKTGTSATEKPAVQARAVPAAAATGALPHTGAGALGSLLCVGAFLLAAGGALLASDRRKRARA